MFKKIIASFKRLNRLSHYFEIKLDLRLRSNDLLNSALVSTESITVEKKGNEQELILSFTTYSKRIHDVHLVIESIAQQTVKPNRLILWLDEDEFTLETIPLILHKQIARGLEIRFCPNYRSYKKLIPTLQFFPEANVITIDDDILYPYDMIEILCAEHERFPDCIIGHRAHKMKLTKENKILPYQQWDFETKDDKPSSLIFVTTGGGSFFPAKCLSNEVLNIDSFFTLCPNADDVWFNAMSILNNVKSKKVSDPRSFSERFLLCDQSQDIGLFTGNVLASGNDVQIQSVFEKYRILIK